MNRKESENNKCPICNDPYTFNDPKVVYHVEYKPVQIITDACRGCNYAEHLIQHPEIKTDYCMEKKKEKVRQWTLSKRPLIH